MKGYLLIVAILFSTLIYSQTQFSKGFEEGFKKGYCYERGVGCLPPITPISPMPNISEKMESYTDGYNRGFQIGLDKSRSENSNVKTGTDRKRFEAAQPEFIDDKMFKFDIDAAMLANNLELQKKKQAFELYQNGQFESAMSICIEGLESTPNDTDYMKLIASIYANKIIIISKLLGISIRHMILTRMKMF